MKRSVSIFRKLGKDKMAASLGIAGLIVGMMCVIYIFLLITDEIGFDRFHIKLQRIIVVHAYLEGGNEKVVFNGCPPAAGQTHNINSPCLFVSGSEVADQWGKKRLRIT